MSRLYASAASFAAILAATMPAAFAQPSPTHETRSATAPTTTMIQADQVRTSKMVGSTVYDRQNRDIGNVKDIILDKDGKVAGVVVDVGSFLGMGGKYV